MLSPLRAASGMQMMSRRRARRRNSGIRSRSPRKASSDQSTRSILLTASTRWRTPSVETIRPWRLVWRVMPACAFDQDQGEIGGRGAGRHVAGVLLMAGRVGDDELAPLGGEEPIRDVDGDLLLALGREPVEQQREIELLAQRAVLAGFAASVVELIVEQQLGLIEQPPDQGRLAVIDRAAGDEAQQALALLPAQEVVDAQTQLGSGRAVIRNSLPASCAPSRRRRHDR